MNNDITGNYSNNFNSIPKMQKTTGLDNAEKILPEITVNENVSSPMDCLNSLGIAQVHMANPNVRKAIKNFIDDEDYANAHVDFCDGLVEKGYKLEEAIQITDDVFAHLKKDTTYKN